METGLIYGRVPVYEYLKAGLYTGRSSLVILDSIKKSQIDHILSAARHSGIRTDFRDRKYCSILANVDNHQGVILTNAPLYTVLEKSAYADIASREGVVVLLDQIIDPHNAGAIMRSAEALGADGIIIPSAHQAPVTPVTVKSSAGASAHLPVGIVSNLAQEIGILKEAGFWIAGSSQNGQHKASLLRDIRPLGIVIGSEGEGMRRLTEKKCDYVCSIPLRGHISSLNASVAAGILLYSALCTA